MKWQTKIFILITGCLLLAFGFALPLIESWLFWFAIFFLSMVGLLLIGFIILSWQIGHEKLLSARATRLELEARARQAEYKIHTDGLGQSFYIGNGSIHSLTTNPKWQIADNHEPTQAELAMQALLFQSVGKNGRHTEESAQQLLLPAPVTELMPMLDTAQRVLIKAASDGGKTTLLQHIADRRVKNQTVLIIDSQSYPDKWPKGCTVVGAGSNHQAITTALDNLITLMVQRYKEIGQGLVREGAHPKLTIIIDEWMAIVSQCPNASDVIRRLLTESRKAAFSVFIGSHSERVKALGLDGQGDLRDGFLIVRIEIENGQRVATYDQGRGQVECILPGQFVQVQQVGSPFEIEAIEMPVATEEEQRILDMLDNEASNREISAVIWQQVGKFYNAKIEATARKFGREVRKQVRN